MNGAALLALSRRSPAYGQSQPTLRERCRTRLQELITERTTEAAQCNPATYFAQVYSDDFDKLTAYSGDYENEHASIYVGALFQEFASASIPYGGFSYTVEGNEDGPKLWIEWLEATKGPALELRRQREELLARNYTPERKAEVIAQGVQYLREETFESERERHFAARAEAGYTIAVFCQYAGIFEGGDAGDEGAEDFPLEVTKAFVEQYPEIDGMKIVLRKGQLLADWSQATGEPNTNVSDDK